MLMTVFEIEIPDKENVSHLNLYEIKIWCNNKYMFPVETTHVISKTTQLIYIEI